MRAVVGDVTTVKQLGELPAVLLLAQVADDIEQFPVLPIPLGAVFDLGLSAHILVQCGEQGLCAIPEDSVIDHIPGKSGEAVGDAADIQFHAVIGIFHIELPVQPQSAAIIPVRRDLGQITFSVDVDTAAADRVFGIAVEPPEHRLHQRVLFGLVVDVQEKISLRDDKTQASRPVWKLTHLRDSLSIVDPGSSVFLVRTCGTAVCREGLFSALPLIRTPLP